LAVAGLALLTGGCAVPPPRAQLAAMATPEALGTRQSRAAGTAANWPSDGWWQAYGDSQLDALIAEGWPAPPTARGAGPLCQGPGRGGRKPQRAAAA
jgi:outer membrane protein TolC